SRSPRTAPQGPSHRSFGPLRSNSRTTGRIKSAISRWPRGLGWHWSVVHSPRSVPPAAAFVQLSRRSAPLARALSARFGSNRVGNFSEEALPLRAGRLARDRCGHGHRERRRLPRDFRPLGGGGPSFGKLEPSGPGGDL